MQNNRESSNTTNLNVSLERPGGLLRFLAFCLYVGFAPVAWCNSGTRGSAFWRTHAKQALTLWAFHALAGLFLLLSVLALSVLMVYHREWLDSRIVEVWILSIGRKYILVWGVFWLYGLWRCLRGSVIALPFLGHASRCRVFRWVGMVSVSMFFFAGLLAALLMIQGERMTTQDVSRGKAFLLYDDLGIFPRPLFSLAMYRLSRESVRRWGPDSAVLLPLTRESVNLAATKGMFVFVGSHGTASGLLLEGKYYRPEDVPRPMEGTELMYVYLASCDSGAQREAWEKAFAPAIVKTYDRLTPTLEHLWWLWTEGPALLRDLPMKSQ